MKKIISSLLIAMLWGSALASDVRQQVEARNQAWADAFNRGDIKAVVAIYDEGFLAIPSGAEPMSDRAQLEALLTGFQAVAKDVRFETRSVRATGKYAYELGKIFYTLAAGDGGETTVAQEYLVIWKQGNDGVWYYHVDAWWPAA